MEWSLLHLKAAREQARYDVDNDCSTARVVPFSSVCTVWQTEHGHLSLIALEAETCSIFPLVQFDGGKNEASVTDVP